MLLPSSLSAWVLIATLTMTQAPPRGSAATDLSRTIVHQVGMFATAQACEEMRQRLEDSGIPATQLPGAPIRGTTTTMVYVCQQSIGKK